MVTGKRILFGILTILLCTQIGSAVDFITDYKVFAAPNESITLNSSLTPPVVWTIDGVVSSEAGASLTTSFDISGSHYVSTSSEQWYIVISRQLATDPIDNFSNAQSDFDNLTNSFSPLDIDSILSTPLVPFVNLIGRLFYLILFGLPFIYIWRQQESMTITTVLFLICGCLFIGFIPAQYASFILVAITIALAYGIFSISRDR